MSRFAIVLLGALLMATVGAVKELPSFYHTTSSINDELSNIANRCSNFISLSDASESPLIKEVNINQGMGRQKRAYLLFGEHPRELISPESGLHFLRDLCSNPSTQENQRILSNYEIRMIVNANPLSREKVEQGSYCLRENENGVDLNRNYDAHWEQIKDDFKQVSSGPSPFSEPETKAIRDSLKNFQADLFLSVHSGTLGMYTPHAYSDADGEINEGNMIDVLERLQTNYCPACDVGAAGREVGYLSPGSCIDYAYDELNIKYAFAFEIFHEDVDLKEEIAMKRGQSSFLQIQENVADRKNKVKRSKQEHQSCFVQMKSKSSILMEDDNCFLFFNPEQQNDYDWYVNNWSAAMNDMLNAVLDKEQQGQSTSFFQS